MGPRSRKTVQDAPDTFGSPLFLDQLQAVFPRILAVLRRAAMDHYGKLRGTREFHLPSENFLLGIAWRVIIIVVKPDFSPRNHLGMPRQSLHLGIHVFRGYSRFVGMH